MKPSLLDTMPSAVQNREWSGAGISGRHWGQESSAIIERLKLVGALVEGQKRLSPQQAADVGLLMVILRRNYKMKARWISERTDGRWSTPTVLSYTNPKKSVALKQKARQWLEQFFKDHEIITPLPDMTEQTIEMKSGQNEVKGNNNTVHVHTGPSTKTKTSAVDKLEALKAEEARLKEMYSKGPAPPSSTEKWAADYQRRWEAARIAGFTTEEFLAMEHDLKVVTESARKNEVFVEQCRRTMDAMAAGAKFREDAQLRRMNESLDRTKRKLEDDTALRLIVADLLEVQGAMKTCSNLVELFTLLERQYFYLLKARDDILARRKQ